jgi:hypothetical protein
MTSEHWVQDPQHEVQEHKRMNHFYEIARPLIERGLEIIPLHPQTKKPAVGWKKFRIWNPELLKQKASGFAHCDVGVVSSRGLTRPMFIDFDDESVIPRIEKETGKKIPATFKVASRPKSEPLRQHHVWLQTPYSLRRFKFDKAKTKNVRDVTQVVTSPSEGKMFKTLYDVKGIGGGSYIVGAGSIHQKTGEPYRVIDTSEIAPIPDWLVDWVVKDIARYRRAWKKMNGDKEEQARVLARSGYPEIAEEDRHDFLLGTITRLSNSGLSGDLLEQAVVAILRDRVQGGKDYAESERGRASIHRQVAANVRNEDVAVAFYSRRKDKPFEDTDCVIVRKMTKRDVLEATIRDFPDRLTVEDAESRLGGALADAGMIFDKRQDKNSLGIVRQRLGFSVTPREWIRNPTLSPQHIYDEGTGHVPPAGTREGTEVQSIETEEDAR